VNGFSGSFFLFKDYKFSLVFFVRFWNLITFYSQMNHYNLIQVNYVNMRKTFGLKFKSEFKQIVSLFTSCSKLQKYVLNGFKLNGTHSESWFVLDMMWKVKMSCSKKWTFGRSARAARIWRTISFSEILHIKLLYSTDSPDCFFNPKNASVDIGLDPYPPWSPTSVFYRFVLAQMVVLKEFFFKIFRKLEKFWFFWGLCSMIRSFPQLITIPNDECEGYSVILKASLWWTYY